MNDATAQAIPPSSFGKDHWSVLAYVECHCVDGEKGIGFLDRSRMRTNAQKHPLLASNTISWRKEWGTRLSGFFDYDERQEADKAIAAGFMVDGHDDWDCLDDLEKSGYVEVLNLTHPSVRLTDEGIRVAALIREHKAKGGQFATFHLR